MPTPRPADLRFDLARAAGRRLYGFQPTAVRRLASENNLVVVLEFGGLPAKVMKLPGRIAPVLREQVLLPKLRAPRWGLPVPAIEFTQQDLPPGWHQDGSPVQAPPALTVMRHEPGIPLADAVLRGDPWAADGLREAGAFVSRLAELPPTLLPAARRVQNLDAARRSIRWLLPAVQVHGLDALAPHLEHIAALRQRPAPSLAHGEFYLENLLCHPAAGGMQLCVCDWETARPGFSLGDLAGLLTSLAWLTRNDPGQHAYLRRRALDGYAATRPIDQRELAAWEVWLHLAAARFHLDRRATAAAAQRAHLASAAAGA